MNKIILKRGREESLRRFHPWVFSGAVAQIVGNVIEGEVVEVVNSEGQFIAYGHYQIGSISVRVLSFHQTFTPTDATPADATRATEATDITHVSEITDASRAEAANDASCAAEATDAIHTDATRASATTDATDKKSTHASEAAKPTHVPEAADDTEPRCAFFGVDFWVDKLSKALAMRKLSGVVSSNTTAYRLVHGEGDSLPGLIIDIYKGTAVLQAHSAGMFLSRKLIATALKICYGDELIAVYDKSEGTAPFKAGLNLCDGYLLGGTATSQATTLTSNAASNSTVAAQNTPAQSTTTLTATSQATTSDQSTTTVTTAAQSTTPDQSTTSVTTATQSTTPDRNVTSFGSIDGCENTAELSAGESIVLENGNKFIVNWEKGQKTGFFLDQRDNRALVGEYSNGKKVLNLFCYTGGFSVYALANGARKVVSVDSSKTAIEMLVRNIKVNNFTNTSPASSSESAPSTQAALTTQAASSSEPAPSTQAASNASLSVAAETVCSAERRHEAVCADAIDYLRTVKNGEFDVIIVDPPAFAKHRGAINNALRAYTRLNANAIEKVAKGGIVFTYSCSQVVDSKAFALAVFSAAARVGRNVKILRRLTQPADHPVNIYHPEGEYLKGLVLYVE